MCKKGFILGLLLPTLLGGVIQAAPLGTAFTYAGRLTLGTNTANGHYDLRFSLLPSDTGGTEVGSVLTNLNVVAANGLFTTLLDFGSGIFNGAACWLQLGVRTNGSADAFVTLSPRQLLTPAPYALYATNAGYAAQAGTASGVAAGGVTAAGIQNSTITAAKIAGGQVVKTLNGLRDAVTLAVGANATLTTNGQALTLATPADWHLGGNSGTSPGANFVGTTDNQPLEFKVNGQRALRLEPHAGSLTVNVIGGVGANSVAPGNIGATIAGGGDPIFAPNSIASDFGTIGGGGGNTIQTNSHGSTIAGGSGNVIAGVGGSPSANSTIGGGVQNTIGADYSTIAGGQENTIQTNASASSIGGGCENTIEASAIRSTIGGGQANTIQTNADDSTIAGGYHNMIEKNADFSSIGGGAMNRIRSESDVCTIGGGMQNTVSGQNATVPGGVMNSALGDYSFAAGRVAQANHQGSFVWGDSTSQSVASSANDEFTVRASGGVRFYSNSGLTAGVTLAPGGGSWSTISDRQAKKDFAEVDGREILKRLAQVPIQTWSYQSQDASIRHLGPMAQDFAAAFRVGEDDRHITTTDADGVALAAIQGLNQKLEEQLNQMAAELKQKEAAIQSLRQSLAELAEQVKQLTSSKAIDHRGAQ